MAPPNANLWKDNTKYNDLLNYLIKRTENVKSPMNLARLARDFKKKSGAAQPINCLCYRANKIRTVIHRIEHIDTNTKVKVLFALSAPVDEAFLKELRKDAVVEVDNLDRITKYEAKNGLLNLHGDPSQSAKRKLGWILRRNNGNTVKKHSNSGCDEKEESETDNGNSGEDSEFDSDNENNHLDETEDPMEPSNKADDFDNETPIINRSPNEMSIADNLDFDPPTEKSHMSEGIEMRDDDEKNDPKITENAAVKTQRSETLPKRKTSSSTSHTPETPKRNVVASAGSSSSKRTKPPSDESMNPGEMNGNSSHDDQSRVELKPFRGPLGLPKIKVEREEYYSVDDQVKLEPFRGEIQEDLEGIVDDKDIQQIPEPMETPIKIEVEEPVEVKPEKSHNSKIKFFAAMQLLIISLDTPFLSDLQSKIHRKIQKLKGSDEVMLDDDLVFIIKIWTAGIINQSVVNLSDDVESVNLSNFLYYLKTAIQNSKMSGVEGLVKDISERIDGTQNKRIPMEILENALRTLLNNHGF
ncbi:unnamed protein product [Caenorhabditis brenneri]